MTAVRWVGAGAAGFVALTWFVCRFMNTNDDTYICDHCQDEGRLVVNEQPPRWAFCNFCVLGQQLEAAAQRKHPRVLP